MMQSGCVMVFITGVLLPVKATFLHAALRLRNIKNKVTIVTCLNEDNMEMEQSGLYFFNVQEEVIVLKCPIMNYFSSFSAAS